jgi:Spy/CpxP family protein refolding chaperone
MLTRTKLCVASLALALLAVVGATCLAQQPQNQTRNQSPGAGGPPPFGRGGPGRRGNGAGGPGGPGMLGPGAMRELNLTDDQKQQIQKIREANFESTKTQREELRKLMQKRFQETLTAEEQTRAKTLHEQMQTSMKDTESKIAAILTPEQKAKLEDLIKERKANHDGFGRRDGFRKERGQRNQSTPPPANPPVEP